MAGPILDDASRRLVIAALGGRDVAAPAWAAWSRDVTLDAAPPAAFAVLPAVSRNLDRLGFESPEAARLRGVFRYAWTRAQLTLRDLFEVVDALARADIRTVAHRGIPTASRALGHPGALYVDQTDLLVGPHDLDRAADVLARLGWAPPRPIPPASVRTAFSWLPFEHPERRRVAVHWRSFPAGAPSRCDAGVVNRAGKGIVQERALLVPDPTDHLLLLCMRASDLAEVEGVKWALELCALLCDPEAGVDGAALVERAGEGGVLPEVEAVLHWTAEAFGAELPSMRLPVPARVGQPRPRSGAPRGGRIARAIGGAGRRYADWCRRHARARSPWGFVAFTTRFYSYEWGADSADALALAAARRLRRDPDAPAPEGS